MASLAFAKTAVLWFVPAVIVVEARQSGQAAFAPCDAVSPADNAAAPPGNEALSFCKPPR